MKSFRRILTLLLVLALLGALLCPALAAEVKTMTVNLRIEGVEANLFAADISFPYVGAEPTLAQFLNAVADTTPGLPEITLAQGDYGAYISEIAGQAEGSYGGWDGWLFRVNGVSPTLGISACTLADGDRVVLYYSDEYGVGMQYPYLDLSRLPTDGTVLVLSDDLVYDADWNASIITNPVAGATLLFDGERYLTDENGTAVIRQQDRGLGAHTVAVERYAENGVPTVLRLAPDTTADFRFADIPDSFLYYDAVDYALRQGLMNGTDATHFSPTLYLNRATFLTILWRAAGCPETAVTAEGEAAVPADTPRFDDVAEDAWYAPAVRWAAAQGIALGYGDGSFRPLDSLTYEQAFTLLWRFAGSPAAAVDYQTAPGTHVSAYALPALSWAAETGLLTGNITPGSRLSRARTAALVMEYRQALAA